MGTQDKKEYSKPIRTNLLGFHTAGVLKLAEHYQCSPSKAIKLAIKETLLRNNIELPSKDEYINFE